MDDATLGRVCHTLMAIARKPQLFRRANGEFRPTDGAIAIYTERSGLSSGELVLLDVAMALWNRQNDAGRIASLLHTLDSRCLQAIGELFVAMAKEERGYTGLLNTWLLEWGASCRDNCPCRGGHG